MRMNVPSMRDPGLSPGRRRLLVGLGASLGVGLGACQSSGGTPLERATPAAAGGDLSDLLDDLERRTFDFFWETTDASTGLAPDRWPTPSFCSVAAVGFALTACCVGVARGYVTRAQARERVLTTLRTFRDAPQGP